MGPGVDSGTVSVPVPFVHQYDSCFKSRLSTTTPSAAAVVFCVKLASAVIRPVKAREAITGSMSEATVMLFSPLVRNGNVRGACWMSFSIDNASRPALAGRLRGDFDLEPIGIMPANRRGKVHFGV